MQDRLPPTRQNPLATHGRTIHRVNMHILPYFLHVRFATYRVRKSDHKIFALGKNPQRCRLWLRSLPSCKCNVLTKRATTGNAKPIAKKARSRGRQPGRPRHLKSWLDASAIGVGLRRRRRGISRTCRRSCGLPYTPSTHRRLSFFRDCPRPG